MKRLIARARHRPLLDAIAKGSTPQAAAWPTLAIVRRSIYAPGPDGPVLIDSSEKQVSIVP